MIDTILPQDNQKLKKPINIKAITRLWVMIFSIFIGISNSRAQNFQRCGHLPYREHLAKRYPHHKRYVEKFNQSIQKYMDSKQLAREKPNDTLLIPLVFHIIKSTQSNYVSDQRVLDQVNVLNQDYQKKNRDTSKIPKIFKPLAAGLPIKFELANRSPDGKISNGIVRKNTNEPGFFSIVDDAEIKSMSYWPSNKYLNIWVVLFIDKEPVLGYSEFPYSKDIVGLEYQVPAELDGVVIDYRVLGYEQNNSIYNLGRTLTHEIGHWLGLIHIWGDDFCGSDFVDDTPQQDSSNIFLNKNLCLDSSNCTGKWTLSMANNYMDYSPDTCMNMFTFGQTERIKSVLNLAESRKALYQSRGIFKPDYTTSLPWKAPPKNSTIPIQDTNLLNNNASTKWELKIIDSSTAICSDISTLQANKVLVYASPYIDFSKYDNPKINIDYQITQAMSNTNDSLEIGIMPYNDTFIKIDHLEMKQNQGMNQWITYSYQTKGSLSNYQARLALRLRAEKNSTSTYCFRKFECIPINTSVQIDFFPNPSNQYLMYKTPPDFDKTVEIAIINSLGNTVLINNLKPNIITGEIDVSSLSRGIYQLQYKIPALEYRKTIKLVLQ